MESIQYNQKEAQRMSIGMYRWRNRQIRNQLSVVSDQTSPTIVLKGTTYLNARLNKWMKANIWIVNDRIVYVGEAMPAVLDSSAEVFDCRDQYIVPGYIEPHVHPFQLYNPHTFAQYAAKHGTTTLINDNLMLMMQVDTETAFSLIEEMKTLPYSMYWWCRFDSQTKFENEAEIFSHAHIKKWLNHDAVLQGGELTSWPRLLNGDDLMLHWIQEAKRLGKHIEGHFPGASERTLVKMKLLGADADHEAMSGKDVLSRLSLGYDVSLRYSSIRPDLPKILDELHEEDLSYYEHLTMNTDGSPPSFYTDGVSDMLVKVALEHHVPIIDAYKMVSTNIARYYNIEHLHGHIGVGCIANLNLLAGPESPTPVSVLSSGKWVLKNGEEQKENETYFPWASYQFQPLDCNWNLKMDDFQFSMPMGVYMKNAVIMEPYSIQLNVGDECLDTNHDECFFMLIDRYGKWRINTLLKGFATHVKGLASSFSSTGDFILIGKSKKDMLYAYHKMKEMGGGIALAEGEKIVAELPLTLNGSMSTAKMEVLMTQEEHLKQELRVRGYQHEDPIYSLLFFSSTHLPYIRVTPAGIYDVMNKKVLFPSIMR